MNNRLEANTQNQRLVNESYYFVSNIRFISIVSIILFHVSAVVFDLEKSQKLYPQFFLMPYFAFFQLGRFGNISFFILSGFLFGISKDNAWTYIRRRWDKLKIPLLCFSLLSSTYEGSIFLYSCLYKGNVFITSAFFLKVIEGFFFSWTWFIFSLFFCLLILAVLRHFRSLVLNFLILILTLVLTTYNYYAEIIPIQGHSKVWLGFLPCLTFGFILGKKEYFFLKLARFVKNKTVISFLVFVILYLCSLFEVVWIYQNTNKYPWYNLRFFNQLYAIWCFLLMCAYLNKKIDWKIINPRTDTVGLFFIHFLVIAFVQHTLAISIRYFFDIKTRNLMPLSWLYPLMFLLTLLVSTSTIYLVKRIKNSRYAFLIGFQ